MIRVETKDVIEVFRVNGMTEFAEHVATLERERDKLADLLREVMACGASYKGTGYAELQVPHWLIAKIRASVQCSEKGESQ